MRKNILYRFIKELSFDQHKEIIKDYEEFEEKGVIGDCLLRKTAEDYIKKYDIPEGHIVIWMDKVVFYVYRIIAEKYIGSIE